MPPTITTYRGEPLGISGAAGAFAWAYRGWAGGPIAAGRAPVHVEDASAGGMAAGGSAIVAAHAAPIVAAAGPASGGGATPAVAASPGVGGGLTLEFWADEEHEWAGDVFGRLSLGGSAIVSAATGGDEPLEAAFDPRLAVLIDAGGEDLDPFRAVLIAAAPDVEQVDPHKAVLIR